MPRPVGERSLLPRFKEAHTWHLFDCAGYHLNQATPRLHDVELGDSLWAFTRLESGRYVLAAELVVRAKTFKSGSLTLAGRR